METTKTYYFIQLVTGMILSSDTPFDFSSTFLCDDTKNIWIEGANYTAPSVSCVTVARKDVIIFWCQDFYESHWSKTHII